MLQDPALEPAIIAPPAEPAALVALLLLNVQFVMVAYELEIAMAPPSAPEPEVE